MAVQIASGAYLEFNGGTMPATGLPFTLVAFAAVNGATGDQQNIVSSMRNDGSVACYMVVGPSNTTVSATHNSAGAAKTATLPSASFQIVAGEFSATNLRRIYVDGSAAPGSDTGTSPNDIANHNRICIGAYHFNTSVIFPLVGSIAEVHVIAGALVASQLDEVKAGTRLPENMTGWVDGWTLLNASTLTSIGGTRTLAITGSVTTSGLAHPVARGGGPTGPTINTQPSNASVTAPATASFTVVATSSGGTLTYQWQQSTNGGVSWANVPDGTGPTSATYTTTATAVSSGNHRNGYQYRCAVSDNNGTVNTSAATLTVTAAPLSVTLDPLVDASNALRTAYTVDKVWAIRVSDNVLVATWTNQTTNGSGVLPALSNAGLTAVPHVFVTWDDNATPNNAGAKVYTPA